MPYKDIDELIKRGINEAEIRSEPELLLAKSRVWESIHLPKKKKAIHRGFVTALAACFVLFIISTMLLLKLQTKNEELAALQAYVEEEKATFDPQGTIAIVEAGPEKEQQPMIAPKTISPQKARETAPIRPVPPLEERIDDAQNRVTILYANPLIPVTIPLLELEIPEIQIYRLTTEQVISRELNEKPLAETKPKTPGKLRFRLGTNSNVIADQHSLALNIKL